MIYQLTLDIQNYWRAGTGRGGGSAHDETVYRNSYGLSVLPGRTLKGLLRDACWRAEQWGHITKGTTSQLFGMRFKHDGEPVDPNDKGKTPHAGLIRVSSAELEQETRDYLQWRKLDNKEDFEGLTENFFRTLSSTAIKDGSAKDQSLRTSEVTIPLKLVADITIRDGEEGSAEDYAKRLEKCLPLVRAIGNNRTRGLGRVWISLTKKEG